MKRIYIPNTQKFLSIPTGNNKLMEFFNLTYKEHETINMKHPKISRANAYLKRTYKRLDKLAKAQEAMRFMQVVYILLTKSEAFRLAAVQFKKPTWYYDRAGSKGKLLFRQVEQMAKKFDTEVQSKRVWIPKGDKPFMRPLGCPTETWRIYSWMFYYFLDVWSSNNQGRAPWQHGGFSKRGVNTFFNALLAEGKYKSKFIYEFDLKGYFNNISHESILATLKSINLPTILTRYFELVLKSRPTKYGKMPPEIMRLARENFNRGPVTQHRWDLTKKEDLSDVELFNAMNYPGPATIDDLMMMPYGEAIQRVEAEVTYSDGTKKTMYFKSRNNEEWENEAHDWIHGLRTQGRGTPQGLSFSPLLSSLTSSYFFKKDNQNLLMYMDDGIIFADSLDQLNKSITEFEIGARSMGVELALNKSGLVKFEDEWKKDLQILGFRIDRFMQWVFSATRSGTQIPIPQPNWKELEEIYVNNKDPLYYSDKTRDSDIIKDINMLVEQIETLEKLPDGSQKNFIQWIEGKYGKSLVELKELIKQSPEGINIYKIIAEAGATGKMLSHIWNPDMKQNQERIQEGIQKKLIEIVKNKKSFLMDQLNGLTINNPENFDAKDLQTLSTNMCVRYLEYVERKKDQLSSNKKL